MPTSEHRILTFLKLRGPQATAAIARYLKLTIPGARKHLLALAKEGLVAFDDRRQGVGRPRRQWHLTDRSASRFPDTHAVVTVEMIDAVRDSFGEAGIERIIAHREAGMEKRYAAALAGCRDLKSRLSRLAALRSEEGYMAEWQLLADGSYLLSENHCPICIAARHCQGFCRSELGLFARALAGHARIERVEHIPAGARRCAYRITPVETAVR
jgi:predicted ArsR family transcriptional regulator